MSKKRKNKNRKLGLHVQPEVSAKAAKVARPAETLQAFDQALHLKPLAIVASVLALLFVLSYWRTLLAMEYQWRTEPDYSHGYLIIPLSLVLLYARRDSFPGFRSSLSWAGVSLILLAGGMRVLASLAYMDFLDGWSIAVWVAGVVWILAGPRVLWWATPAVLFLLLLVPIPYRLETLLSWKLQSLVTLLSSSTLRIFGLPAVAEGNTIWIGESQMMVEEACSGMRIFVGMFAFAFFWASMVQRAWIDRIVILAAALPMAIVANTVRVVLTCCFFYWFDDALAKQLHDWAGILMIFLAAALLWAVKEYWQRLYRPGVVLLPSDRMRSTIGSMSFD